METLVLALLAEQIVPILVVLVVHTLVEVLVLEVAGQYALEILVGLTVP